MVFPRPKRRIKQIIVALGAAALLLIVFVAIILTSANRTMVWYVSPPIDAQDRRVHILLPRDWTLAEDKYKQGWADEEGSRQIVLKSSDSKPTVSRVQEWLIKLKILPRPQQSTWITLLAVGDDVEGYFDFDSKAEERANGKLRYPRDPSKSIALTIRVIKVPQTRLQAGVLFTGYTTRIGGEPIEAVISNSMYVE